MPFHSARVGCVAGWGEVGRGGGGVCGIVLLSVVFGV